MQLIPHHDGSDLYVSNSAPKIGEVVEFKIRIPRSTPVEEVHIRFFHDGEPRTRLAKRTKVTSVESWFSVKVEVINSVFHYRFMVVSKGNYSWLNGAGLFSHDVTDREDFQIIAKPHYPRWIQGAVFYQIFPDRFAKSDEVRALPEWAVPRSWNRLPKGRDKTTGVEFYGGDFPGIVSKLEYLQDLGVNSIYFTPAFPSRSNHRYDATSFDEIDPLLGGDKAFVDFSNAAHAAGFKIMGDLTTNHCGAGHRWIEKALKNKSAKEREFFYWDKTIPHGYVGWWGLASLPKLNYNSQKLRELMFDGENSVVRKWLRPPFAVDGWRIDVGNMTGIYLDQNLNQEVSRGIRRAMDETNSEAWLVAENADHSPSDLDGFGWHGTMNYNGFARPLVNWFNTPQKAMGNFSGLPGGNPRYDGFGTVAMMRAFAAGIPWRSLVASMVLLDSHDTARFRSVVGNDEQAHLAAATLLFTYPGVPSIFAGDELGLEGAWGEDSRRTIDWDHPEKWNQHLHSGFKSLIAIRKKHDALINGGLRWIHVSENCMAYLRESKKETLLVFVSRQGVREKINLKPYGLKVSKTLYGPQQNGSTITINSKGAISGVWKLS
ncbi:MAG: glycoside hydrolase family 13 protein [Candidatus Planktophila sp.]